jgi:hypothetical protein
MAWDANGSPIDGSQNHPSSASVPPRKESISDLFVIYREALSQALSDGDLSKLDEAHERLKAGIKENRRA